MYTLKNFKKVYIFFIFYCILLMYKIKGVYKIMKNIKFFKYKNTNAFEKCLNAYGYTTNDAVGFSTYDKQQYHGNILKEYVIYLADHDRVFFKEVCFKDFNEIQQARLGFNGNKLLRWYEDANVRKYKTKGY